MSHFRSHSCHGEFGNEPKSPPHTVSLRRGSPGKPRALRLGASLMSGLFLWSGLLATPAQVFAHPVPFKRVGVRLLQTSEMARMVGRQGTGTVVPQAGSGTLTLSTTSSTSGSPTAGSWIITSGTTTIATSASPAGFSITSAIPHAPGSLSLTLHAPGTASIGGYTLTYYVSTSAGLHYGSSTTNTVTGPFSVIHPGSTTSAGNPFAWQGGVGGVNTSNGNKLTSIPLVGWKQNGGLPVSLALVHNSQSAENAILGPKWTHSYDIFGSLDIHSNFTVHWGDGTSYTFGYGLGAYHAPTGIYETLVENIDGSFTLTTKDQIQYHFNTSLRCDTITDENGNAITLSYSGNLVTSITDATGREISLSYTSNKITGISDPLGRSWTVVYSGTTGLLQQVLLPLLAGQTVGSNCYYGFSYNSTNDISTFTSPGSRSWTATYNADDSIATQTDGCSNTTTYGYAGSVCTVTDANGHTVASHSYNSSGLLSTETDAIGNTVVTTFDTYYNKTNIQDQRGKNWAYTYDSSGNVLTATDPLSDVTTYTYNSHNKLLTKTDALSDVVTYTYDSHDNLLTVVDGLGHTTVTKTYGSSGLMATSTDALSHSTSFGYDTNGELTSVTDANSNETTFTVNDLGWRTEVTDPLSHSTSTSYDNWGRVSSVTTPAGTTSTGYDPDDNATSITDPNSHTTTTTFDNDDRPLVVTKANGDSFTYVYDGTGQKGLLSYTTDGNSHNIYYSYDSLNRKTGVSYPDSTCESWTYDAISNIASHTDGNGHTITYSYDNANKLTGVAYPSGTGAGSGVSYTYDAAGRETGMTDVTGTWGYTFDVADRLTQISAPNGTTGYGFDNANRRTSMTLSTLTGSWSYSYDAANRLTSLTNPYSETTSTSYDAANRVTSVTNGNSTVTAYSYDSANRVTLITHSTSGSTTLAQYQYTYDSASNVSTRTDTDGTVTTFGYDNSDQLTSESRDNSHGTGYSLSYAYDHNSNRTSIVQNGTTTSYSYDAHDKLTSAGSKNYAYDSNGNCTSVTVGSSVTSISYDIENRVIGITYPGGATNSFAYNGEDLRTQKVDSTGSQNYITDGSSPASDLLSDGNAVYTPGLSEHRGSTSKFYHGDALGSTRGITNSGQSVTDSQLYDGFGNTVSRTGTTPTPFGFVGAKQYQSDSDSGLQLLGHRYYDPSTGRFLSIDPAKAGTNCYAYCGSNPVKAIDPSGLIHIVITIDPVTHLGIAQVYSDEGDFPGGNMTGPLPKGKKLREFPIGNITGNITGDPTTVGSNGPFPKGNYPIGPIYRKGGTHPIKPSMGVGTIKIGRPGQPPWERGAEMHGGRGSYTYPTNGCIRANDPDLGAVIDILEANPHSNNRITVQ